MGICPNCLTNHNETYLEIDAVTKETRELPYRPKIVELCEANVKLKAQLKMLEDILDDIQSYSTDIKTRFNIAVYFLEKSK